MLGSLFEREITQKLNSKLIALRAEIIGSALAGRNQTKDLSDFTDHRGRTPTAYLYWESLFEREILQNRFKIKQNLGEAPVGLLYISARFAWKLCKIYFKIKQNIS